MGNKITAPFALPSSNLSMTNIANELGISTTNCSLNNSKVRYLAGRPSGTISYSDLRGKAYYNHNFNIGRISKDWRGFEGGHGGMSPRYNSFLGADITKLTFNPWKNDSWHLELSNYNGANNHIVLIVKGFGSCNFYHRNNSFYSSTDASAKDLAWALDERVGSTFEIALHRPN